MESVSCLTTITKSFSLRYVDHNSLWQGRTIVDPKDGEDLVFHETKGCVEIICEFYWCTRAYLKVQKSNTELSRANLRIEQKTARSSTSWNPIYVSSIRLSKPQMPRNLKRGMVPSRHDEPHNEQITKILGYDK